MPVFASALIGVAGAALLTRPKIRKKGEEHIAEGRCDGCGELPHAPNATCFHTTLSS